ncbi:hypothetical protein C8Q73DRAFT_707293 [Cubamyces lactineus]|nr:hypothetical protein C8Q73DRAFT_707293 [Cubamyces lactineus]
MELSSQPSASRAPGIQLHPHTPASRAKHSPGRLCSGVVVPSPAGLAAEAGHWTTALKKSRRFKSVRNAAPSETAKTRHAARASAMIAWLVLETWGGRRGPA